MEYFFFKELIKNAIKMLTDDIVYSKLLGTLKRGESQDREIALNAINQSFHVSK